MLKTTAFHIFKIAMLLLPLGLAACSSKKEASPTRMVYFVKGDPFEIIKGAELDKNSPFNDKNIQELNGYRLVSLHEFVEKEEVLLTAEKPDLTKENETKDRKEVSQDIFAVNVEQNSEGEWSINLLRNTLKIKLKSMTADGQLQPVEGVSRNSKMPIEILHWSKSTDGNENRAAGADENFV